jgi:hypothetical protein
VPASPLFRQQAYVGGKWVNADSGQTFPVFNPATLELVGEVPDMNGSDTQKAIEVAEEAFLSWSATTAKVSFFTHFFNMLNLTCCTCVWFTVSGYNFEQNGALND